ncbi:MULTISPECIES: acetyl/propionyl/methylcrotonyl-CoA carboxylase subunit alpha [Actinokineospora]|uniref:Biotin-dependent acyl-coenzyme A carboxylase alpha3 subunit n=1 Tax=Actinokineospora fastidiosa TaxID=1816 RepID=A0A918L9Z8_9PSEU|nr:MULTISPECIES: acetyl/propionyl/methylcrotonyl-CoA carboxylase subunit alpha [Actinokineospora]UVS81876.1 Biotin carboxylase [Actinokineospora sp. UTMC 2448]GGS25131.1 acetyl-/propionyl-CoA carboxylase subunit alpha [Actinokineospora fastidiosa]
MSKALTKVLIANRGEIAVRVIRACRDAGLTSVAVYADPDRDAVFVRLADEAFALGGSTPGESYLSIDKVLAAAKQSGADAVHPGYGFLSENAEFAQAVIDAGLVWVGPDPQAIRDLGDKVTARHIATRAGAPLVPGTKEPVGGADEIIAFAQEHGLPVAIKAAFGGGGRGLKVARTIEEIPELFDSAVREAVTAFGRGECFVERYLDKPRHVEAQVLADKHGNVIVVGTRDCSLQRRHQKLVEEAPAPFLTDEQRASIHASAKAICKEAGYSGAGTVEYLVGLDGTISFLEVNTRLQVEHPVSEETTGIDLVREQFRIAAGEKLRFTEDPTPRGHSIEFRINGEDAGRGFLPAPGTVTRWVAPEGPGVRVDSGVESGTVIGGQFDSLLAKLIVTGADRDEALARARRALDELVVEGMATVTPFHRAIVRDPAFAEDFTVHTRWIETEWDNTVEPFTGGADAAEAEPRQNIVVEVGGRRLEVSLPGTLSLGGSGGGAAAKAKPRRRAGGKGGVAASGDAVAAPMQGTIVKVAVEDGAQVAQGDLIVVLEAMKMENPVTAHKAGTVTGLGVAAGDSVTTGTVICEIKD